MRATGERIHERAVQRVWERLRRRAQKAQVRPLKLHSVRHTWATLALHAGKSVRWVAGQLGHGDPAFTMRVYAHALREEETDLGFADFGAPTDGPKRPKLRLRVASRKRKSHRKLVRRLWKEWRPGRYSTTCPSFPQDEPLGL